MFKDVKDIAAKQKKTYLFTKGWFVQQFPDYGKLPDISSNGKILYVLPVDPLALSEKNDAKAGNTSTNSIRGCSGRKASDRA